MHRIQWFDSQIREGNYPNSRLLAERFEISSRQAQRDIEYMMVSLRAPLVYIAKQRGYCYEDKTFSLPFLYMTEEEKRVLKFLAFRYRNYSGEYAQSSNRIAQLLERITDEEEPGNHVGRVPIFDTDPRLVQHFHLLTYAIERRLVVQIVYRDPGGEDLLRLQPIRLAPLHFTDCIVAYCEQREKLRSFRLDCIRQVTVTREEFDPALIEQSDWVEGAGPIRRKPFTAKVLLDRPIGRQTWHGYPVRSVEGLVHEIEFYDPDAFLHHLFASEWEQLLSPKWLLVKLQGRCRKFLER